MKMAIPPFPLQDLAKLVLGYLAEEQLMTAYDEFLHASPYLDALKNEYDRILMTSLKNILAEYRAVKIYVENCKPYFLRKRLLECCNLLEVVKFLVQHVDVGKIQGPDTSRASMNSRSVFGKSVTCAICNSLKIGRCVCRDRFNMNTMTAHSNLSDTQALENLVETTSLEDLPGTHLTSRRKHVRVLPKETKKIVSQMELSSNINVTNTDNATVNLNPTLSCSIQNMQNKFVDSGTPGYIPAGISPVLSTTNKIVKTDVLQPLHIHNSNIQQYRLKSNLGEEITCHTVSAVGTFQDFSKGVKGSKATNSTVPDSSTSENHNAQTSSSKDKVCVPECMSDNLMNNGKPVSKARIFLTVGTIKESVSAQATNDNTMNNSGSSCVANLKGKTSDQKVTILSDIKVDKKFNNDKANMPAVLKNATSTPLMQMQTILINGTPVYKQQPLLGPNRNFTKDEIMAMPTIIVVPTSGPARVAPCTQRPLPSESVSPPTSTITSGHSFGPLVIDVPSDSPSSKHIVESESNKNMPSLNELKVNETEMLVKTVDVKHVSLPKGNIEALNKGTPAVQPPLRKSSSTPRRTSHVRVLDFTTPRRILEEEAVHEQCESPTISPVEVMVSRSPNLNIFVNSPNVNAVDSNSEKVTKEVVGDLKNRVTLKEKDISSKALPTKKPNWDADLRAIAKVNKKEDIPESRIEPRCRPKTLTVKKKKLSTEKNGNDSKEQRINKGINKDKILKNKPTVDVILKETEVKVNNETSVVAIKPTINIITSSDWHSQQETEKADKTQNKSNEGEDTPEMDRLLLQNAIGAKLNISDFLETPYKQALYDIQMETPRFLGPDLPGEPLSDIKINNIPTPRFLNTVQATPSSYSSRPTDYSSSGSYYKPDDQDYMPVDDIGYPLSNNEKEITINTNVEVTRENHTEISTVVKSSRPIRKCAKNVSYYNNSVTKTKDVDDKLVEVPSHSGLVEHINLSVNESEKEIVLQHVRESKSKAKSETKKRKSTYKKYKTPTKKETAKTFMKIKPRRVTPVKETLSGKSKGKLSNGQGRKRTSSKDKKVNVNVKPVVVSAPTKSRRKSSTPRKLHCTKTFNSESSGHDSPDLITKTKPDTLQDATANIVQDSDTEQLPLRWSDDGSQDVNPRDLISTKNFVNETEDISRIKEYIASELHNATIASNDRGTNLHVDLVKRGFDVETARSIERDLLGSPPQSKEHSLENKIPVVIYTKKDEALEKAIEVDSDTSSSLKIVQDDEDCDEIELSVSECNESSENYFTCYHDTTKDSPDTPVVKLKDKFSMEVCVDDDLTIRLRATPFNVLFEEEPQVASPEYSHQETEMAVNSIANIEKLYTPMKDAVRAQVYELFDSTLTSIDTPMKVDSPKRKECDTTVTEIVLEVEKVDDKDKTEVTKRKRVHSGESESITEPKRPKPEAQYLLNSANIQNIDIETVLSKLHGP